MLSKKCALACSIIALVVACMATLCMEKDILILIGRDEEPAAAVWKLIASQDSKPGSQMRSSVDPTMPTQSFNQHMQNAKDSRNHDNARKEPVLAANLSADSGKRSSSGVTSLPTQTSGKWAKCQNQLVQSARAMTKGFETNFSSAKAVIHGGLKEALERLSRGSEYCSLKGKLRRWVARNHRLHIAITGGSASQSSCEEIMYSGVLEQGLKRDFEDQKGCGAGPVQVMNFAQVCVSTNQYFGKYK
jgi:hypothetical protein